MTAAGRAEHGPEPRTLLDLVEGLAGVPEPRGVTFVDERFREERWTWRRLHEEAGEVAARLQAEGLRPGEPVLLPLETSPDAIIGLLALLLAGAVPSTVPGRRHLGGPLVDPVDAVLRITGPRRILRPESVRRGPCATARRRPEVSPLDLALVQHSSGTTRTPKGVELTHAAVLANLRIASVIDRRDAEAVHVTWLPLYHDMGLVGGLLASLVAGHELVLMDPACFVLKPVSWIEALSRHRATSTAAPNFALAVTCDRVPEAQLRRRQLDLSSLRSVFDGAEPVRPLTVRRFEERLRAHGLRPNAVRPVYGLAEATLVVTAPEEGEPLRVRRFDGAETPSVGRPVGDFEVRIARPGARDARPVAAGAVGEILLRGTCVTRGYHGDAAATRAAFTDGWLRTGDLGVLDEEGRLYVTGRLKDLLIVAGRNYYAHEIGDVVDELPFARRGHSHAVAVPQRSGQGEEIVVLLAPAHPAARRIGRAAEDMAERLAAWGAPGRAAGAALRATGWGVRGLLSARADAARLARMGSEVEPEVRRHVQRELGLSIDRVEVVSRLPKTTSGKVAREACVRLALERRPTA